MSLPGWNTWRHFIDATTKFAPSVTFELLATRRALQGRGVAPGYSVKCESRGISHALNLAGIAGPFALVGHSAGATIALDFALDHSADVRSLTLIEPGAAWVLMEAGSLDADTDRFLRDRHRRYVGRITKRSYAAFFRQVQLGREFDMPRSPVWPLLCVYRGNMRFRPALFAHRDRLARLRRVRFPVLLVHGRESDRFHARVIDALRSQLPNVTSVEMPGGHSPHHGKGKHQFLRQLTQFHRAAGVWHG